MQVFITQNLLEAFVTFLLIIALIGIGSIVLLTLLCALGIGCECCNEARRGKQNHFGIY